MKKMFWVDPYQTKLHTTVASVNGNEVVFHETIGYAESGGQESDKATVNGLPVLSSRMDKESPHLIYYTLPDNHGLSEGSQVSMEIDWPRRNRLMRLHFCCELVLVLVNRFFNKTHESQELKPEEIDVNVLKTGAHMSETCAHVDFQMAITVAKIIPQIQQEFDAIIAADKTIEKGFLDEASQHRFWHIEGLATVPCGGTHVKSTGEVGYAKFKRKNGGKGIERVEITLKDPTPGKNVHDGESVTLASEGEGSSAAATHMRCPTLGMRS